MRRKSSLPPAAASHLEGGAGPKGLRGLAPEQKNRPPEGERKEFLFCAVGRAAGFGDAHGAVCHLLAAVGEEPDGFNAVKRFDERAGFFIRHQERCGGKQVRVAGILGDDGHGAEVIGRHERVRIDQVMIVLAVHGVKALIIAGGDHGAVGQEQGFHDIGHAENRTVRILNAHAPALAAVKRGIAQTDVAACADDEGYKYVTGGKG